MAISQYFLKDESGCTATLLSLSVLVMALSSVSVGCPKSLRLKLFVDLLSTGQSQCVTKFCLCVSGLSGKGSTSKCVVARNHAFLVVVSSQSGRIDDYSTARGVC